MSTKSFIGFCCLFPFFMILSTVFIIDKNIYNGVVYGKHFWFYISISSASLSLIALYIIYNKSIKFTITDILISSFYIIGLITSYSLLCENINTTQVILFTLVFMLYFYFKIIFIQSKSIVFWLILFFILTGLIEVILGFIIIPKSKRYSGTIIGSFTNSGPYSGYLAVICPIVFYYVIRNLRIFKYKFNRFLAPFYIQFFISLITLLGILYILPLPRSRAYWIASFIGCTIVGFNFLWIKQKKKITQLIQENKVKSLIVFISILCFSLFSIHKIYHIKNDHSRAMILKISFNTLLHNKVGTGIGSFPGSYGEGVYQYFSSKERTEQEKKHTIPTNFSFNEPLRIRIEFGLIGIISFLALNVYVIYIGMKKKRFVWVAALLSLLVFSTMSFPFSLLPFLISYVFLIALCTYEESKKIKRNKYVNTTVFFICISLIVTTICLKNRYTAYNSYKHWTALKQNTQKSSNKDLLIEYKHLVSYLGDQSLFLREYARYLSYNNEYIKSNKMLEIASITSFIPSIYYSQGVNYKQMEKYEEAEKLYWRCVHLFPKYNDAYYYLAELYMETNKLNKAEEMINMIMKKEASKERAIRLRERLTLMKKAR